MTRQVLVECLADMRCVRAMGLGRKLDESLNLFLVEIEGNLRHVLHGYTVPPTYIRVNTLKLSLST